MPDQRDRGIGWLAWRSRRARTGRQSGRAVFTALARESIARAAQDSVTGEGNDTRLPETADPLGFDEDLDDGLIAEDDCGGVLDLAALHADDELLDAVGGVEQRRFDTDQELGSLLLSWRQEVDAERINGLIDAETAVHEIFRAAHAGRRRRPRYLVPLACGIAALVVMFAGMGLAARNAQPGDTLWGLTQVLYADHARSIEAAALVRTELDHASTAIQQGRLGAARSALAQAQQTLPSVANEDGQAKLQAQQQDLVNQLDATSNGPGAPVLTSPVVGSPTPVSSSASNTPTVSTPPSSTGPTTTTPSTTTSTTSTDPPPTPTSSPVPTDPVTAGGNVGDSGQDPGAPS